MLALLSIAIAGSIAANALSMKVDYCAHANSVVVGKVISRVPERDATEPSVINTMVDIEVERTLVGDKSGIVELRVLGGRIGDDVQTVFGQPKMSIGSRYLLLMIEDVQRFERPYLLGFAWIPSDVPLESESVLKQRLEDYCAAQ